MTDTDRQAWLDWRAQGLGASDIAGIMRLSPWQSPWSVWARKVGLTGDTDANESQEFGQRAEPMLAQWFTDATGLEASAAQTQCHKAGEDWMRCTIDGAVHRPGESEWLGLLEIKTDTDPPWKEIPVHYQCQATWQCIVTGHAKVWFAVLHLAYGHPKFRVYEYTPTVADRELIVTEARRFWHDHVLAGVPPKVDASGATRRALNEAWQETTDEPVDIADALPLLERRQTLKESVDDLQAQLDEIDNQLRAELGDHERATANGHRISWRWQERHGLDVKRLKAEQPSLVERYGTTTRSRVLRITPPSPE